jgi:aminopeptidase N
VPDNLSRTEAHARANLVAVTSYEVTLDLTAGETAFASTTRARFTAVPGSSTFIELEATQVRSIILNGERLDPALAYDGARINLDGLTAENVLDVDADCAYSRTGEGLHRFVDPVDGAVYLYTQFETYEAHRVMACFDQPDLKAPWSLTVHCPREWVVVSTTAAPEPTPGRADCRTWCFPESQPLSTYLYAVVAGPYFHVHESHDGIPLGLYCRASLSEFLDAEELFTLTRQGFDFYHQLFGVRYPFGKYDQLFVPEFNAGAMENAGCVTFLEDYVFRSKVTKARKERRAETLLHELAHMWFGDLVTMRWWDDLWLNESFATYVSVHAQVQATEFTEGWTTFANAEKTWALRQDQLTSTHPVVADAVDMHAVRTNFDGITYAKGAALLKQLVAWVGQEEFYAGLRTYFAEHAWGNTELTDLLRHLEASSGRELASWRDEWLLTTGVNTLRPVFEVQDGAYTSFAVEQGSLPLRSHRVAIGLYSRRDGSLVRTERVELDLRGPRTEVPKLVGLSAADLVLVNDDDLTFAKVRLDPASWQEVVTGIGTIADSLARTLCWGAAWDMTRDAEVPAGDFITLVSNGVQLESEVGVVSRLLGQVRAAVVQFGSPALIGPRLAALSDRCAELALTAAPGGDHQLAFVQGAAANLTTADQVQWAMGLLDGSVTLPGLTVDTDLRWALVGRLAALGRLEEGEIRAELDRDRTATGEKQVAAALAARPLALAKQEAWAATVQGSSLSNHLARATMSGFNQPEQAGLLAEYPERFYAALDGVWATRSQESAMTLTQLLFPSWDISAEGLARADSALARELPAALHRTLLESRDGLTRALRCRAREA